MSSDDYKGILRFKAKLFQKVEEFWLKLWIFLACFVVLQTSMIYLLTDKEALHNTGVYYVGKTLTSVKKGDIKLKYKSESGERYFTSSTYSGIKKLKVDQKTVAQFMAISVFISFVFALPLALGIISIIRKNNKVSDKKIFIRGAKKSDSKTLAQYIKESKLDSPYYFASVPWLKSYLRKHLSISGDTGSGKTVILLQVLDVIRSRNEKAIILDKNGELLATFYDPKKDKILSPFDDRSEGWTPFNEGTEEVDFERLAKSFIPSNNTGSKDDHWPMASVTVFNDLLYNVQHDSTYAKNVDGILTSILDKTKVVEEDLLGTKKEVIKRGLYDLLEGTLASLVIDKDSPEHAASVIASIIPKIRSLRYLRGLEKRRQFSIRDWVKDDEEKGWLFIRVTEEQLDSVSPLITAWLDTAIKSALSLKKSDGRVIWNVIDELQSLEKINSMRKAFSEGRKHGLRNVIGYTSINELFEIYGKNPAISMFSQCNTKILFRTDEGEGAKWNSELFGKEEVVEKNESENYGDRNSMGENDSRSEKPIVMPSEIQSMPDFTAYLKFSGDWPLVKIKTDFIEREEIAPVSVERKIPPPLRVMPKVMPFEKGSREEKKSKSKDTREFRQDEPLI